MIKVRYNKNLEKIVNINEFDFNEKVAEEKLKELISKEIIEFNGCYYFSFSAPKRPFSKELEDRTGSEVFFNKIMVDDYFDCEGLDCIAAGIGFSFILINKLDKLFSKEFCVICSYDGSYCSISFHRKRNNENWLVEDLESYKMNSLLVLEN